MGAAAFETQPLPVDPALEQGRGLEPALFIAVAGQRKDVLGLQTAGQRLGGRGIPLHLGAETLKRDVAAGPEAHAAVPALGVEAEPEGRTRALLPVGPESEPEVVVHRPAAVEPPGVAVDPGEVEVPVVLRVLVPQMVEEGVCQVLRGPEHQRLVFVLVRLEPLPGIVQPQGPEELHGFFGIGRHFSVCCGSARASRGRRAAGRGSEARQWRGWWRRGRCWRHRAGGCGSCTDCPWDPCCWDR